MTTLPAPSLTNSLNIAARAVGASKIYGSGDSEVRALDNVDVSFEKGKFTAIMGPSGSGKSTLMHCVAGLDSLTAGNVFISDTDLSSLNDKQLTELRRKKVGFIFQAFNLIPTLSAEENIMLPLTLGRSKGDRTWIDGVIDTISLRDRLKHRPSELSGGQQQRTHLAQVLTRQAEVLLLDEPTAGLDINGRKLVADLIASERARGVTVVMATHELQDAENANTVMLLAQRVVSIGPPDVALRDEYLRECFGFTQPH